MCFWSPHLFALAVWTPSREVVWLAVLVGVPALGLAWQLIRTLGRTQSRLESNRRRLQGILGVLPDLGLVLDAQGRCHEILGGAPPSRRPDAIPVGESVRMTYSGEAAKIVLDTIRWASVTGQTQTCEFERTGKYGETRTFEVRLTPLRDPAVARRGPLFLMLSRDVTERRDQERQCRDRIALFDALFRQSSDALLVLDMEGRPVAVSAGSAMLFGDRSDTVRGRDLRSFFADGTGDAYRRFMSHLLRTGQANQQEDLVRADGTVFPAEMRAGLLSLEGPPRIQLAVRDLARRRARAARERRNARRDGLQTMGRGLVHDGNNILLGLVGGASLLRTLLDAHPDAIPAVERLAQAGQRMTRQIERLRRVATAAERGSDR